MEIDHQEPEQKYKILMEYLSSLERVVVAYSGGVDSSLLSGLAFQALGKNMLAVTINSPVEEPGQLESAKKFAQEIGFPLEIIDYNDLTSPVFRQNPVDRCYHCKLNRLGMLKQLAVQRGYDFVLEGSNADDLSDYRPGKRAVKELGILSPFVQFQFRKADIRNLARLLGYSVWNKPGSPCLATRFPYGTEITQEKLRQISDGETKLKSIGLTSVRLRVHNAIARIECNPGEIQLLINHRDEIVEHIKSLGFQYVTLDLEGYRLGSLNIGITE